jgi:hypothetical protein
VASLVSMQSGVVYAMSKVGRCMLTVSKPVLKVVRAYGCSD